MSHLADLDGSAEARHDILGDNLCAFPEKTFGVQAQHVTSSLCCLSNFVAVVCVGYNINTRCDQSSEAFCNANTTRENALCNFANGSAIVELLVVLLLWP